MALSPADFAAYSRATGTPYPEDPEKRAELAPEVLEFRRNQLGGQQEESNLPNLLGAAALGLGALGGGVGLAKMLSRKKAAALPLKQVSVTPEGKTSINTIAQYNRQRSAEDVIRQARTERPTGITQTNLPTAQVKRSLIPTEAEAIQQYSRQLVQAFPEPTPVEMEAINAPSQTSKILTRLGISPQYRPDPKDINYLHFGLPSPEVSAARRKQATQDLLHFAQRRQADAAAITSQTIGALESGEDQITGRTMRGVQRNEDLDSSQINALARQFNSVDVAASMTPDGVPVDQLEISLTPQKQAQSFLEQKRQELSSFFAPGRVERVLSSDPAVLEAAELYAATGDPNVLSRFSSAPSSPLEVKPTVQMSLNDPNLPTKQFFKPTGIPEYTGDLLEKDIELTNKISTLGAQQQQLISKAQELGEQELMLRVAMEREPSSGGTYTNMFGKVKYEQQNLVDPASLNVDIGDALAEREFVRNQIKSLENLGSTYKLTDLQEGVRPYYEYDVTGKIIPETLELRGGRRLVNLLPKQGGGRLVAEYDPEGQTGSAKGIYGVEQASRRSSETVRPTQMTMKEFVQEGLEQSVASPEGDVPIPPSFEEMTEKLPTLKAKRSLQASQAVRQAIIEGRDPQVILRQRGFNV